MSHFTTCTIICVPDKNLCEILCPRFLSALWAESHFLLFSAFQLCGIITQEVDRYYKENPGTKKAAEENPLDQAISHHQDHPWEDTKSDHEHIWIRVTLVLASFDEVGAAGSPAEGEERNDDGNDNVPLELTR